MREFRSMLIREKAARGWIALLQIGGALGAAWTTTTAFIDSPSVLLGFVLFPVWCAYAIGVAGAILMWRDLRLGVWLSIVHQTLLIPVFSIPEKLSYALRDMVHFDIGLSFQTTETSKSFGVSFDAGVNLVDTILLVGPGPVEWSISANLVPLTLIFVLIALRKTCDSLVREPAVSKNVA